MRIDVDWANEDLYRYTPQLPLRAGRVQIEDETKYACFLEPGHWNGWARPWFPLEEAREIAQVAAESTLAGGYDKAHDAFVFVDTVSQDPAPDIFIGEDVMCPDGVMRRLYPIGLGCWIWSEAE